MTTQHSSRPNLPPEAEAEILELLSSNMRIHTDEITAILEKHRVSADTARLQDRYRKQLAQRFMSSIRDEDGQREILYDGKGQYVVLECCSDEQQLKSIRRRIQGQMKGLDTSANKVQARIHVLERLKSRLAPKEQENEKRE